MKVMYIRVSTAEQNTDRQEALIGENGIEKVFLDKLSGKNTNRPQLQAMMEFVREGDTVVVESYSRLARSTRDLLDIIDKLSSKGVRLISKKENIDTNTPTGRLALTIFAGVAQFELEINHQRQREGIEQAKLKGKYKGRQPIQLDPKKFEAVYASWKNGEITAVQAQKQLKLSATTYYRKVRTWEQEKKL